VKWPWQWSPGQWALVAPGLGAEFREDAGWISDAGRRPACRPRHRRAFVDQAHAGAAACLSWPCDIVGAEGDVVNAFRRILLQKLRDRAVRVGRFEQFQMHLAAVERTRCAPSARRLPRDARISGPAPFRSSGTASSSDFTAMPRWSIFLIIEWFQTGSCVPVASCASSRSFRRAHRGHLAAQQRFLQLRQLRRHARVVIETGAAIRRESKSPSHSSVCCWRRWR
jgi:hypothetical protein